MPSYPNSIVSFTPKTDGVDDVLAAHVNDIQAEIQAIETELGTLPKGPATDVKTLLANLMSGWVPAGETWTYLSATTFRISGDQTGKYGLGDKVKLTQTSIKYFYIVGISYSAPNTTITVTGGDDYTLANAAITDPYYSKSENPQGFPDWFAYANTSTIVGWVSFVQKNIHFKISSRSVCVLYYIDGTSNSVSTTFTVPITPIGYSEIAHFGIDNGTGIDYRVSLGSPITLYTGKSGAAGWTVSGSKRAIGEFWYKF